MWRLNNMLLNNQQITGKIKEEIKEYLETNENKNNNLESMGCSKSSSKREVYSNTNLPQETRKISNKQPNITPKGTRKRRTNKTQNQSKERNHIKVRAEINRLFKKKSRKDQ